MKTGSVATSNSVKAAIASSGTHRSGPMGASFRGPIGSRLEGRGRIQEKSGAEPVYCIWM